MAVGVRLMADAVGEDAVHVRVELDPVGESLQAADNCALAGLDAMVGFGAGAVPGGDGVDPHADDLCEQLGVPGHPVTEPVGQAQGCSAIRLPSHDGHMPRDLHENATSRSSAQEVHRTRAKPELWKPHSKNRSTALSTKPGIL